MNQNQEDRTTMFAIVAAYMDKNKALWTATKATVETVAELNVGTDLIGVKAGRQ